jgi:hypothetical protein
MFVKSNLLILGRANDGGILFFSRFRESTVLIPQQAPYPATARQSKHPKSMVAYRSGCC